MGKYTSIMGTTQSGNLWDKAKKLDKQGQDVADFQYAVDKLPYQLRDEYRKAGDPKLDNRINEAQQNMFAAPIEGMEKYQDISNPFERRALAEKYSSIRGQEYGNLTSEKERRQGKLTEYIEKWTGLFSAEAARKQNAFSNAKASWEMERTLANDAEDKRRWEITNARASAGSGSSKDSSQFMAYAKEELSKSVGEDGKYDPNVYNRLRDEGLKYKIDKGAFDAEASYGLGEHEWDKLGIERKPVDYSTLNADEEAKIKMGERKDASKYGMTLGEYQQAKSGEKVTVGGVTYRWKDGKMTKEKEIPFWFNKWEQVQ